MCVFCKILANEISSYKVYEDDDTIAILDITQITKGHTLVIPKKHCHNILELDDIEFQKLMHVVKELSKQILEVTKANGINILSNINEVAGQTVMHAHVHLIPRYDETDDIKIHFDKTSDYDLDEVYKSIIK